MRDKFFALTPDQYSQFSDFFRYELLHQRGGWWIDMDVLCRPPMLPSQPVVVGETRPGKLCGAIMRFPRRAPSVG
jgi:mannosyltransferase OCH1-like enzyme